MSDYGWAVHEAGHAIAYLAANPDLVERVEILNCGDYAQIVPIFSCEPEELGISHLVNFCCGCLAERIWAGEKDAVFNLINAHGNLFWLEVLFDTPHGGGFDKIAFRAIANTLDPFPKEEFATALLAAEKHLEHYLPLANMDALHKRLLDGGFSLTARDLQPVMH